MNIKNNGNGQWSSLINTKDVQKKDKTDKGTFHIGDREYKVTAIGLNSTAGVSPEVKKSAQNAARADGIPD
jgi:hypothetical protein